MRLFSPFAFRGSFWVIRSWWTHEIFLFLNRTADLWGADDLIRFWSFFPPDKCEKIAEHDILDILNRMRVRFEYGKGITSRPTSNQTRPSLHLITHHPSKCACGYVVLDRHTDHWGFNYEWPPMPQHQLVEHEVYSVPSKSDLANDIAQFAWPTRCSSMSLATSATNCR